MRRFAAFAILSAAAVGLAAPAEAQYRYTQRSGEALILRVQPRSFLDAGTVVPVGSYNYVTSGQGQVASYLNTPPYVGMRDRFGEGVLSDPITNSPFVGGRNPFGPIDFSGRLP
jgi:hypothetical protein